MAEIKIICVHCNQRIQCDEGYRGMDIDCPNCKRRIDVPTAHKKELPAQIQTVTTEQLQAQVEDDIRQTLKANGVMVKAFQLAHLSGIKYSGDLTVMTAQGMEQCSVDVTFDGKDFIWQIAEQQASTAKRPVGMFLLSLVGLLVAIGILIGYMPYNDKIALTINVSVLALALTSVGIYFSAVISKR